MNEILELQKRFESAQSRVLNFEQQRRALRQQSDRRSGEMRRLAAAIATQSDELHEAERENAALKQLLQSLLHAMEAAAQRGPAGLAPVTPEPHAPASQAAAADELGQDEPAAIAAKYGPATLAPLADAALDAFPDEQTRSFLRQHRNRSRQMPVQEEPQHRLISAYSAKRLAQRIWLGPIYIAIAILIPFLLMFAQAIHN